MTSTTCTTCHGKGYIETSGYRFYSLNARFCPCGAYATLREACNAEDARRTEEMRLSSEAHSAERRAARLARAAARRAAQDG